MTRPRISVFLSSLNGGGAERALCIFADTASKLGVDAELVCAHKVGPLVELYQDKLPIVDLGAPRMSQALIKLRSYLKKRKPDALYSSVVHANLAAILASRFLKKRPKIIIRESNAPLSEKKPSLSRKLAHLLAPRLYVAADHIIAVSEDVAQELHTMLPQSPSPISVLPNPVVEQAMFQ